MLTRASYLSMLCFNNVTIVFDTNFLKIRKNSMFVAQIRKEREDELTLKCV